MLFFYVRHGDPTYNPDALTPIGERQAEAIGRRLARYGLDRIYSSSANRAMQTARPAAELTRREIIPLDWCKEGYAWDEMTVDDGTGSGKKTWCFQSEAIRRMFSSPEVLSLGDKWYEAPGFPENRFRDGLERVGRETDAFMLSLGYRHDRENRRYVEETPNDERIALFAHQGFGMTFLSCLLDVPYPLFASRFDQTCTGMTVIEFASDNGIVVPKMLELSCDAHLYAADLPTEYNRRLLF